MNSGKPYLRPDVFSRIRGYGHGHGHGYEEGDDDDAGARVRCDRNMYIEIVDESDLAREEEGDIPREEVISSECKYLINTFIQRNVDLYFNDENAWEREIESISLGIDLTGTERLMVRGEEYSLLFVRLTSQMFANASSLPPECNCYLYSRAFIYEFTKSVFVTDKHLEGYVHHSKTVEALHMEITYLMGVKFDNELCDMVQHARDDLCEWAKEYFYFRKRRQTWVEEAQGTGDPGFVDEDEEESELKSLRDFLDSDNSNTNEEETKVRRRKHEKTNSEWTSASLARLKHGDLIFTGKDDFLLTDRVTGRFLHRNKFVAFSKAIYRNLESKVPQFISTFEGDTEEEFQSLLLYIPRILNERPAFVLDIFNTYRKLSEAFSEIDMGNPFVLVILIQFITPTHIRMCLEVLENESNPFMH